jgi:hypothetical protein
VAAVPAAAVAVGRQTDHVARHWAQARRSANHLVAAVLLRNAPATGSPGPVHAWTGPAGATTDPPLGHPDIVGDVCVAVMATCLVSWLMLLAVWTLGRHVLDRRRLSA